MGKPVHRFAFVLFVLAGIFFLIDLFLLLFVRRFNWANPDVGLFGIWTAIKSIIGGTATLVALGLIVEMVDQIRWKYLTPEERARQMLRPSLFLSVRRWPGQPDE